MSSALEIQKLTKKYGNFEAVKDVSFSVEPGEIFGLLGPNGAGKTSLISCLVTLENPSSGQAKIFGHDVQKQDRLAKSMTGFVPQELINHGYFNVEEILNFHSGYYGLSRNGERIAYLLEKLALTEHRHKKVKALSGGMKRRLLIAKALVHNPKILLLDEPTAGVDIDLRSSLWTFVEELRQDGLTILLTTHYLEEAENLCDRVGILHHGELLKVGPTKELIEELTQRVVVFTLQESMDIETHPFFMSRTHLEYSFQIPAKTGVGDLLAQLKVDFNNIQDLRIQEGKLEDAFLKIIGERSGRARA